MFEDRFSGHAAKYARFRPTYPEALFEWLASVSPACGLAWDCGTGNGQAAVALAAHFESVLATDGSAAQIANAVVHPKVRYWVALTEIPEIDPGTVDLITVAQALHWFDLTNFYTEVNRVLRPKGIIAVWCYHLPSISPGLDGIVYRLYRDIVGPYWPPKRKPVESGYAPLRFPFEELGPATFQMEARWDLEDLLGYFNSWSSTQEYIKAKGTNPIDQVLEELSDSWGIPETLRRVEFPLHIRVGVSGAD